MSRQKHIINQKSYTATTDFQPSPQNRQCFLAIHPNIFYKSRLKFLILKVLSLQRPITAKRKLWNFFSFNQYFNVRGEEKIFTFSEKM